MTWLLPFPPLCFYQLELGELEVPASFAPGSVPPALCDTGLAACQPRHASCSLKSQRVNSSYFSGEWERLLCLEAPPGSKEFVENSACSNVEHTNRFSWCLGVGVCSWKSQCAYLGVMP